MTEARNARQSVRVLIKPVAGVRVARQSIRVAIGPVLPGGDATISFTASATAIAGALGDGTAAMTFIASAASSNEVLASGNATITFDASASSQILAVGSGTTSITFTATADGYLPYKIGSGTTSIAFTASATGVITGVGGSGVTSIIFGGSATGEPTGKGGTGSAPIVFSASATVSRVITPVVAASTSIFAKFYMDAPAVSTKPMIRITPVNALMTMHMDTPELEIEQVVFSATLTQRIDVETDITTYPASYGVYDSAGYRPGYRVDILKPGGDRIETLENATVTSVSWELCDHGSATFTMPLTDPKINNIQVPDREVQIWQGQDLLWWGVIVRAQKYPSAVEFQCLGLSWYFTKRYVGRAEQNYLQNGSFEHGLHGWDTFPYSQWEPGETRDDDHWFREIRGGDANPFHIMGEKSLFMQADSHLHYGCKVSQTYESTCPADGPPEGDIWTLSAWCWVPDVPDVDDFIEERIAPHVIDDYDEMIGMKFSRLSPDKYDVVDAPFGRGEVHYRRILQEVNMGIGNDVPRNMWVRLEASMKQAPGTTEWIMVTLGTPIGGIYWDEVTLVKNERLWFGNTDQAKMVEGLVQHAQDPAYGKSDLRIGTHCPRSGVKFDESYEFWKHDNIYDAISKFPEYYEGVDWDIAITPTTRTFRTHFPIRGSEKKQHALVLGKNIAEVSLQVDGEQVANRITVTADGGEGASREEGVAAAPSFLDDGLILEMVFPATPGSPIYTLRPQAIRGLERWKRPVLMYEVRTYEVAGSELLGVLHPGDIVPVRAQNGWIQMGTNVDASGNELMYRINTIDLDPNTGILSFGLNPWYNIPLTGRGNVPPNYKTDRKASRDRDDDEYNNNPPNYGNPRYNPGFGGGYPGGGFGGFNPPSFGGFGGPNLDEIIWSYAGMVADLPGPTEGAPWPAPYDLTLTEAIITGGSPDFGLYMNGDYIGGGGPLGVGMSTGDILQAVLTGGGGEQVAIIVRYRSSSADSGSSPPEPEEPEEPGPGDPGYDDPLHGPR